MAAGAHDAGWRATSQPVADGGEGSLTAVHSSRGGAVHRVRTVDANLRPTDAPYLLTADGSAVVVAADTIGLEQLRSTERDPERTTTLGLAAVVQAALGAAVRRVVIFIGGVATVDGGLGLLVGLGADARDADGQPLSGTAHDLYRVASLDLDGARTTLRGAELVVATDVVSPLYGPDGAAQVFGPQKGADAEAVVRLDAGLRRLAPMLGPAAARPGAGAAGGLGAALMALGAERVSGAETVLDLVNFSEQLRDADLCITAEGSVDRSTSAGKAVSAVLARCAQSAVPCVVLGGSVTDDAEALYDQDAAAVLAIGRTPRRLPDALDATAEDLRRTTRAVCTLTARVLHR
jgi:glycerate kinase